LSRRTVHGWVRGSWAKDCQALEQLLTAKRVSDAH
jgi:hypothetical protein